MRSWNRRGLALVLLLGALPIVPKLGSASPAGFVYADGPRLMVDGKPWRAIGVNVWDMDAAKVNKGDITGCYYLHPDLDSYFDQTFRRLAEDLHVTAVRTFGFRMQYTAGGADWSSTDKLLHYARLHDVRVIPVLGDQYAGCGSPFKTPAWYHCTAAQPADCTPGYREKERPWGTSYRDYAIAAARRYAGDPTVAFWQLMNEAQTGNVNGRLDTTALVDFSRDMVRAIREEAGDTNHLINTGTLGPGSELPQWGWLLGCSPSSPGGCTDLAEAHYFNVTDPLPGAPFSSAVDATVVLTAANGETEERRLSRPVIDGWSVLKVDVPLPPSRQPYRNWSLRLSSQESGWAAFVDEVTVVTTLGPQTYSFEAGTDGFYAIGATVATTTRYARAGVAALQLEQSGAAASAELVAPVLPGPAASIEFAIRMPFAAPAPSSGAGVAVMMHEAVVARRKPFFTGEAGLQAEVPGLDKCGPHRSLDDRAAAFDGMLARQTDDEHQASGFMVWDWKDPAIKSTTPAGSLIADPTVDCWTVTPGDPTEDVLRRWADLVPATTLPLPQPLPQPVHSLAVLTAFPTDLGSGTTLTVQARLTLGGNSVRGAVITASGACAGSGATNALGTASFSCRAAEALGGATLEIGVDQASCACPVPAARYAVTIKRVPRLTAAAGVAERETAVPLTVTIEHVDGSSVKGLAWSVPDCGLRGVVGEDASTARIVAACPVAWDGVRTLHVVLDASADTLAADVAFAAAVFDRVYVDEGAGDCVGLSPGSGWIGFTARTGACDAKGAGTAADWFTHNVPAAGRSTAFSTADRWAIVAVDAGAGRRLAGRFDFYGTSSRSFTAVLTRPDGVRALGA